MSYAVWEGGKDFLAAYNSEFGFSKLIIWKMIVFFLLYICLVLYSWKFKDSLML